MDAGPPRAGIELPAVNGKAWRCCFQYAVLFAGPESSRLRCLQRAVGKHEARGFPDAGACVLPETCRSRPLRCRAWRARLVSASQGSARCLAVCGRDTEAGRVGLASRAARRQGEEAGGTGPQHERAETVSGECPTDSGVLVASGPRSRDSGGRGTCAHFPAHKAWCKQQQVRSTFRLTRPGPAVARGHML